MLMRRIVIFCGDADDEDEDDCFRCSYHVVIFWHCLCLCLERDGDDDDNL